MKSLRRYLSLLFALVMSLSVFSISVRAEETESTKKLHMLLASTTAGTVFGQHEVIEGGTGDKIGEVYHNLYANTNARSDMTLAATDGSVIMPSGFTYTVLIENIVFSAQAYYSNGGNSPVYNFGADSTSWFSAYAVYADGSIGTTIFSGTDAGQIIYNDSKGVHSVKLQIDAQKDVLKVFIREWHEIDDMADFTQNYGTLSIQQGFVTYPLKVSISQQDPNTGLLGGILGKITDLWETAESGFANMVKGITELPQKLWDKISEGLKSLFVPSEEDMVAYKDKWDELLSSRLGAVYQVVNILTESWDDIMAADQTDTIEFPSATIPLPGDSSFSFGGYTIQIVPDGFSVIVTAIKSVTGIICTIAFVNGLRRRYDEIMGVEA